MMRKALIFVLVACILTVGNLSAAQPYGLRIEGEKMRAFFIAWQDLQSQDRIPIQLQIIENQKVSFFENGENYIFTFEVKGRAKSVFSENQHLGAVKIIPKTMIRKSDGDISMIEDSRKRNEFSFIEVGGDFLKAFLVMYEDFRKWKFENKLASYIENYDIQLQKKPGWKNAAYAVSILPRSIKNSKGQYSKPLGDNVSFMIDKDFKILQKQLFDVTYDF